MRVCVPRFAGKVARLVPASTASAVLLLSAPIASATTPAAYRAYLNGVCRSYTSKLDSLSTAMKRAQQEHDAYNWGRDLGVLLNLGLAQDATIRRTAVPATLGPTIEPILSILSKIDAHAQLALAEAAKGSTGWIAEMQAIGPLTGPLDRMFDGAGLRDCGSNQN